MKKDEKRLTLRQAVHQGETSYKYKRRLRFDTVYDDCDICGRNLVINGVQIIPEGAEFKIDHMDWGPYGDLTFMHEECSHLLHVFAHVVGIPPKELAHRFKRINTSLLHQYWPKEWHNLNREWVDFEK